MVEYALLAALVVVVLIGVIQYVTDRSSAELSDRGNRVGAPDLQAGEVSPTSSTSPSLPPSSVSTVTPPAVTAVAQNKATCWSPGTGNNNWNARFSFTVVDQGTGKVVEGAVISANYQVLNGDSGSFTGTSTTEGKVSLAVPDLRSNGANAVEQVDLQVTGISGTNITGTGLPFSLTVRRLDPSASPSCV